MSTRGLYGHINAADLERHENARKAIQEARKLLPGWQATARMLSRNPGMQIKLTAGGFSCTDGKVIHIKVPYALANLPAHDRVICGQRGEHDLLICEACDILEDVNITVIHEVCHIIFDTFQEVTEYERSRIIENAVQLHAEGKPSEARLNQIKQRVSEARKAGVNDYLSLSQHISPFMPLLINACEDIRVNARMQQERPGTKVMFNAQTAKVFRDGIKGYDGVPTKWSEAPPNAQAIIGVYCKAGGFDYKHAVDADIAARLDDQRLDDLADQIIGCKSMRGIYNLAIPLLERLRELGFCLDPEDPEDPPPANEEQEQENSDESGDSDEDAEEGESSGSPGDSEGEPNTGSSDDGETDSEDDSAGTDGEPSDMDSEDEGGSGATDEDQDQEGGDSTDEQSESPGGSDEAPEDEGSDGSSDSETDQRSEGSDVDSDSGSSKDGESSDGDNESQEGSTDPVDPVEDTDESASQDGTTPQDSPASGPDDAAGSPVPDDTENTADSDGKDSQEPYSQADQERDGTPEDVETLFTMFGRHEEQQASPSEKLEQQLIEEALEVSLDQIDYFDSPSLRVGGVTEYDHSNGGGAWSNSPYYRNNELIEVSEGTLVSALQRLRLAFTDNARGRTERNRRSGKIDGRVLAKRAPLDDDRLFKKKVIPGKKDYFVLIGLDVSGSTSRHIGGGIIRLEMMKAAAGAKAELLSRLGIEFAMYAHSGSMESVDIFHIKTPKERWGKKQKEALADLKPYSANLDGHTLEYYRKVVQARTETDKLILYYTDGHMPAANFEEELEILQREIKMCEKLNIHLIGVGVNSDSPKEHGLDTILLNELTDIPDVVNELRKRLMK